MKDQKIKSKDLAATFVNNYKSEQLSLTGVIKNSLLTTGFDEVLTSLNLDAAKVTAKNVGYFIPCYMEYKTTFTANNLVNYLKRFAAYNKKNGKIEKKTAYLFCLAIDMAKLAKQADKINAIVVNMLNTDTSKFNELQKYLFDQRYNNERAKLDIINKRYEQCAMFKNELKG